MTCEACKERPATVHYSQMINGVFSEVHLCESCSKEKGVGALAFGSSASVGGLLSGLVEAAMNMPSGDLEGSVKSVACSCGITVEEFKRTGFLGCPDCYKTFKKHLAVLLKRIHGTAQHRGSSPIKRVDRVSVSRAESGGAAKPKTSLPIQIRRLKREMGKAVDEERFEEAAQLRDQLKQLTEESETK